MLELLTDNLDVQTHRKSFAQGETIFLDGDESKDLYILVSGRVGIFKGDREIAQISKEGAIFGEMSFLLGSPRTATVRASSPVEAVCIPRQEIAGALGDFTPLGKEVMRLLAKRLDDSGRVLQGLSEVVDNIPEAVIITNRDGEIMTFNDAARNLYGGQLLRIGNHNLDQLHLAPQSFQEYFKRVQRDTCGVEEVFEIKHPELGQRFVSLSMTCLYDAHQNYQGMLALGRDVTTQRKTERRFRLLRLWFVPTGILLALLLAAGFWAYPYFTRGVQVVDSQKRDLQNQLGRDFVMLKSLLAGSFEGKDGPKARQVLAEFFKLRAPGGVPYTGVVLLDPEKKVIEFFSPGQEDGGPSRTGVTYGRFDFKGRSDSLHRVFTVYRNRPDTPGSRRILEMAFEVLKDGRSLGWVVLGMDAEKLEKLFGADEETLLNFYYPRG